MQRIRLYLSGKRRPFHLTEGTEIINIVLAPPVTAYPLSLINFLPTLANLYPEHTGTELWGIFEGPGIATFKTISTICIQR